MSTNHGSKPQVFVGLDYHQHQVQVCVLDAAGKVLMNYTAPNEWRAITQVADRCGGVQRAAIEACCGAADLAEQLVEYAGWSVQLAGSTGWSVWLVKLADPAGRSDWASQCHENVDWIDEVQTLKRTCLRTDFKKCTIEIRCPFLLHEPLSTSLEGWSTLDVSPLMSLSTGGLEVGIIAGHAGAGGPPAVLASCYKMDLELRRESQKSY